MNTKHLLTRQIGIQNAFRRGNFGLKLGGLSNGDSPVRSGAGAASALAGDDAQPEVQQLNRGIFVGEMTAVLVIFA